MASRRDQQVLSARDLDQASTALITIGTRFVKKNPIKVSMYLVGVIVCLFFTGFRVTQQQREEYSQEMQKVNHEALRNAEADLHYAYSNYYRNKGWFTCNAICQEYKAAYDLSKRQRDDILRFENSQVAVAKSKLGLFSEYGVEETKGLFWQRFAAGKDFAKRQSMFDMLFIGIGAMTRDESMIEYIARIAVRVLMNFTIGIFMSVVTFIFSLYSLIATYQASIFAGLTFFFFASLAAISFALSWLVGLYCCAAGAAYVGFTIAKGSLRLEGGGEDRRSRIR